MAKHLSHAGVICQAKEFAARSPLNIAFLTSKQCQNLTFLSLLMLPIVPPAPGRFGARVEQRAGRIPSSSSSAIGSGRVILDRVARRHHRHTRITMHFSEPGAKGDVSTLPGGGHFYFALTRVRSRVSTRLTLSWLLIIIPDARLEGCVRTIAMAWRRV